MIAKLSIALLLLGVSAAQPSGHGAPMTYGQPMTYAAPSYDVSDVTKIVDFDYAINDYYGNEQTRKEHVEPGRQIGHWSVRLADGSLQTVNYDANDYGNLAHVIISKNDYAAPAYSAPAKTYAAPAKTYAAPAKTYAAPSYSAPSYSAPVYVAPKVHYNYEEKNIYVPKTYAAPKPTYAAPKMHYNYEEKNTYAPKTYAAPMKTYSTY